MTKIIKLNNMKPNFVDDFKDKELLIYEDIQGSRIFVNFDGFDIHIKPKSISNPDLNIIDMTTQLFYTRAYIHFHDLSNTVVDLLPKNYVFGFEYFPDNKPAKIEYDRVPKNNLILTCIYKNGKYIYNYAELLEYSKLFECDCLPVLYKGILNNDQLNTINKFLTVSDIDKQFLFGEDCFASFFYKLLNVQKNNSFLMADRFNQDLEKIIIKIGNDTEFNFEILNPKYNNVDKSDISSEYAENYSLILINFLSYVNSIDFMKFKPNGLTKNDIYIDLICKLFIDHMSADRITIINWNINVPDFYNEEKYKLNLAVIKNEKLLNIIKNYPILEYYFRVVLDAFRKERKKCIGLFSEQTLQLLNSKIIEIRNYIDTKLNANLNYDVLIKKTPTLDEFIAANTDLEGRLYPDFSDVIEDELDGDDKKDGKKMLKKNGKNQK